MKSSRSPNEKLRQLLLEFVEAGYRNTWLQIPEVEIYVRSSFRIFDNVQYNKVIDIANISVTSEFQGHGIFKTFLNDVKIVCKDFDVIYVENILTPKFEEYFIKNNWHQIMNDGWFNSYYLKLKE